MFCMNCGTELSEDARFCTKCGTPAGTRPQKQTTQPSQPQTYPSMTPTGPIPQKPAWLQPRYIALAVITLLAAIVVLPGLFGGTKTPVTSSAPEQTEVAEPEVTTPESTPEPTGPAETWAVFVYFCGSNLETNWGAATDNILELLSVDLPDNVTFVLETGGADAWQNNIVDANYIERYEVSEGTLVLKDQQPRTSMSDESTFTDFISWGAANYPADHYMLIFWDHGGGSLLGVCQDELDYGTLTLPEMGSGLQTAGVHFDIVGYDTCLMACLEMADTLSPYADYMVASEEVEPGGGWDWAAWPAWFADNPHGSAANLGICICDTYMDKCAKDKLDSTATLSVVDLSCIEDVVRAFNEVADDLALATEKPGSMQKLIGRARDVQAFGNANYIDGYTDMVDLADLMAVIEDIMPESTQAVISTVNDAVVYERHGRAKAKATGLSVFYPMVVDTDTFLSYYSLVLENKLDYTTYLQYLAVRSGDYDIVDWSNIGNSKLDPVTEEDIDGAFQISAAITDDGRYAVDITGNTECITGATFSVYQILPDGSLAGLGSDNDLDLEIDAQTGAVRYIDRFTGYWYKIGDAYVYADIVDMVWGDDKPSYNLYSTPVEWTTNNSRGERVTLQTNLLTMYDYDSNSYEVLCVYEDCDESGMAGKSVARLSEGDELTFLVYRDVNGETQVGNTGHITWTDDTQMTVSHPGDATYVYVVTVTDLFGNSYMATPALISFEGGERSVEVLS